MRGKVKELSQFLPFLPDFSSFSLFSLIFPFFFLIFGTSAPPWPPPPVGYATDSYLKWDTVACQDQDDLNIIFTLRLILKDSSCTRDYFTGLPWVESNYRHTWNICKQGKHNAIYGNDIRTLWNYAFHVIENFWSPLCIFSSKLCNL